VFSALSGGLGLVLCDNGSQFGEKFKPTHQSRPAHYAHLNCNRLARFAQHSVFCIGFLVAPRPSPPRTWLEGLAVKVKHAVTDRANNLLMCTPTQRLMLFASLTCQSTPTTLLPKSLLSIVLKSPENMADVACCACQKRVNIPQLIVV
jgi:hypothetical protein